MWWLTNKVEDNVWVMHQFVCECVWSWSTLWGHFWNSCLLETRWFIGTSYRSLLNESVFWGGRFVLPHKSTHKTGTCVCVWVAERMAWLQRKWSLNESRWRLMDQTWIVNKSTQLSVTQALLRSSDWVTTDDHIFGFGLLTYNLFFNRTCGVFSYCCLHWCCSQTKDWHTGYYYCHRRLKDEGDEF